MKKLKSIGLLVVGCWLVSCDTKKTSSKNDGDSLKIKYAKGFSIQVLNDGNKLVEVGYPYQGAKSGYKYLLVQKGNEIPKHEDNVEVITVPIESIVCTSTTHIPLLDYLDETNKLIGFPTTDYISSEKCGNELMKEKSWTWELTKA